MNFQSELIKRLKKYGDRTAIENGDEKMSFDQLLSFSGKITQFLSAMNLGKETVVGIQLTNKLDIIGTMIGVMNARCVFVLIDGNLPEKRIRLMLEDLNLEHLITSARTGAEMSTGYNDSLNKYYLEDIAGLPAREWPETDNCPDYKGEDSLYIYYTSGSTGVPKGIVGRNGSLLQFINWELSAFGLQEGYRYSQFVSPYFDAFLRDIFVPIFSGGTICLTPGDDDFFTPDKLIDWIDSKGINAIHCVPSVLRIFNVDTLTLAHFGQLRYIFLSGERIFPAELANWYRVFDERVQLVNLYGPTETTMVRFFYKILPSDVNRDKIPVGEPIEGTDFLITSNGIKANPKLIPGELYIISAYTTKGYLNAPELTAKRFFKPQHQPEGESGMISFRTGDKARLLADGKIDLLGRDDRQIKLRGVRIELDEVERVIFNSSLVKNAVVIKHGIDPSDERLVAFVVRNEHADGPLQLKDALFDHIATYLPGSHIPSDIVELDHLPLLSNGKVDYTRLVKSLERGQPVLLPVNEIEAAILGVWKEILGSREISTEDNFQAMGGNSLGMMKLIGRFYKLFNVKVSLSDLFKNLTIKSQAILVKSEKKDDSYIISKAPPKEYYNTSAAQQRLFYSYELDRSSKAYNQPVAWKVDKGMDKRRLQSVLNQLAERHESLRTRFMVENEEIVQVVESSVVIDLEVLHGREAEIASKVAAFSRPFDLEKVPLVRCALLIVEDGKEDILLFDAHHIICDGISQMNLYEDFVRLSSGETLLPLETQYKDYAEWEYHFRDTSAYLAHRHFWLKAFEGRLPELQLPVMTAETDGEMENGGQMGCRIEKSMLRPILQASGDPGITTFSSLFSLYFLFLAQLTGQDEIVIGVPTSGRIQEEVDRIVGMFVKTLPVRYKIDLENSFVQEVAKINAHLITANGMQMYDLADILSQLNSKRNTPLPDLFNTMFVFHNFSTPAVFADFVGFSGFDIEKGAAKYPITLFVNEEASFFDFQFVYSKSFFSPADMRLLINEFTSLVTQVAANLEVKFVNYVGMQDEKTYLREEDFSFNFK